MSDDNYLPPQSTCDQHLEDMAELVGLQRGGFSTPHYAAGVLAMLVVRRGQQKHAVALGQLVLATRTLDKVLDLLCTGGDVTNEDVGRELFKHKDELRRVLGRP